MQIAIVCLSHETQPVCEESGRQLPNGIQKFLTLLKDPSLIVILVEHKDRATRFGFGYLDLLLTMAGRRIRVVNRAESNRQDLLADLTSVISSLCVRLYGQRRAKIKAKSIVKQVEETCGSSSNT